MKNREYETAIAAEVERWPDVTVEFVAGGKHPKAKLAFGGKLLAVPYSGTPGDGAFGIHDMLGDMRRAMKKLGAVRDKPEPSKDEDEAPYRKANDGAAKRPSPVAGEKATPKPTLAEQVAGALESTEGETIIVNHVTTKEQASRLQQQSLGSALTYEQRAAEQALHATARAMGCEVGPPIDDLRAEFEERVESIVDGVYFGLPADVYHAVPRLSSSGIQRLCVSPATFWRGSWLDPDRPDPDEDETVWQVLGRAYHTARLEPHLFESTYVRELDKGDAPKGTLFTASDMSAKLEDYGLKKSGSVLEQAERLADSGFPANQLWPLIKKTWEIERGTRTPLPAKHYDQMLTDRDRITANHQIAPLLSGGEAEVSIFWTDQYGIQMKARVDYLTRDWWDDFKTFDNSRGKNLKQALADSVRYNRYYVQAVVYREAIEAVRTGGLQVIEAQTDDQHALVAHMRLKPGELKCWYIFQEKGGIPNLLAYEFPFYAVPYTTILNSAGATEKQIDTAEQATRRKTGLFHRGETDALQAKKLFALYSQVYKPGEPWFPIEAVGEFSDDDFHPYWLAGDLQ